MSKIIKITESQLKRLLSEQDDMLSARGDDGSASGEYSGGNSNSSKYETIPPVSGVKKKGMVIDPTYKPDMSTGWLGHTLEKDGYVYNGFGGKPFHSSYFCPRYTGPNNGGDGIKLPNKEITQFRDLIFKLIGKPKGPSLDPYYMNNVYKGLKYYINNVETNQKGFVSDRWGESDRKNYVKMLRKFSSYVGSGNLTNRCWHYSIPDVMNQVITKSVNGVWEWTSKCASDYHCVLDVASIVVLIIPPPAGVLISAGLDVVNSIGYYSEGSYLAGSLTLLGVIPGVMEVRKMTSPVVVKTVDEFLLKTSKITGDAGSKPTQEAIDKIYTEVFANKGLTNVEIESAQKYLNVLQSNKELIENYSRVVNELSKYNKKVLLPIIDNPSFKQIMKSNKGDVVKSLKVFSETEMGRDVYIQIGAFGLVEALSVMVVDDGETDDIVPDSLMLKNIVDVINDKNAGNWRDDIPDEWK